MKKLIMQITRFTGTTVATFPHVAWLGYRNNIASIEVVNRAQCLEAAGIEPSEDITALQQAGLNVECYALVGERTITARAANADEVLNATGANADKNPVQGAIGHVFPELNKGVATGRMLITTEPVVQLVVEKVAPTIGILNDQLSPGVEMDAMVSYNASLGAKTTIGADIAKNEAAQRAQAIANQANWKAIQAEKKAAHAKSLTGVDAGAGVPA